MPGVGVRSPQTRWFGNSPRQHRGRSTTKSGKLLKPTPETALENRNGKFPDILYM